MLNNLINQGYIVNADQFNNIIDPEAYKKKLLDLISVAKNRILMNCLYLENDESGRLLVQALKDRVQQNPQLVVDIFVDLHRAQRTRFGQEKSQINAHWYYNELAQFNQQLVKQYGLTRNPINIYGVPCNARELFGVYHIKGFVIDDALLYTGASINNNYCAYSCYRLDRYQLITNKELADSFYNFTITNFAQQLPDALQASDLSKQYASPVVCFSSTQIVPAGKKERLEYKNFRQNFLLNHKLQYQLEKINPNKGNNLAQGQILITPLYGIGKNNFINQCVFDAIRQAKEHITIYTPYFNFTKNLTKNIIAKINSGVKVTIIVSDKVANDFYSPTEDSNYSSANALPYLYEINLRKFVESYQDLIDKGLLEIYAWKDGDNTYHAKGLDIDGKLYILTGSNLNLRSFNVDAENSLLVHDPHQQLQQQIHQEYQYFLKNCQHITHFSQIQTRKDYPQRVRRTLRRASFFFIDKLAKRLF